MFHVEHADFDAKRRQAGGRFGTGDEDLCAAPMQGLKHPLLMMTIQFRSQIIQLQ